MKILFFAPHAGIWIHSFPEALVADSLVKEGHEVIYLGCRKTLANHCIVMSAQGIDHLSADSVKAQACNGCIKNSERLKSEFGFADANIESFIQPGDEIEIEAILNSKKLNELTELVIDEIPVGRLALYYLLLKFKKNDLSIETYLEPYYHIDLKNTLKVFFAAKRFLAYYKPDRLVVYNSLYPVLSVVCALAEKIGIPALFLHAGPNISNRLSTLLIGRSDWFRFVKYQKKQWPEFASRTHPRESYSVATNHFLELLRGKNFLVYSTPKEGSVDVRKVLGIDPSHKLIVAAMSSNDEWVAAESIGLMKPDQGAAFQSQIEWVQALIAYFADRENVTLVIRVHPREFPNKREGAKSQNAEIMEKIFQNLPSNIKINWPKDEISIFDLANQMDVLLSGWSSVGKEVALLGIPVVLYSKELCAYPPELNLYATTPKTYFEMIEFALQRGWSAEQIRTLYRWYAFDFVDSVVDISDGFKRGEGGIDPIAKKVIRRLGRLIKPDFVEFMDCKKRSTSLQSQKIINKITEEVLNGPYEVAIDKSGSITEGEEDKILRVEMSRLMKSMYGRKGSGQLYEKLKTFTQ